MTRDYLPTIWSGLGMNFGGDLAAGGSYDASQINADLAFLKSSGFTRLRMALPAYGDSAGITRIKNAALLAKAQGFYVSFGVTNGGGNLTASLWNTYHDSVITQSTWAKNNNIDEFQIGNEIELSIDGTTLTETQLRINLRTLATDVKANGYTGKVSYSTGQGYSNHSAGWITDGTIGDLDYIALNVYGNYPTDWDNQFQYFISQLYNTFGAKMYISEFNVWYTWANVTPLGTNEIVRMLRRQLNIVKNSGVARGYVFTWRYTSDNFACKQASGDIHPMFFVLINDRPSVVNIPNQNVVSIRAQSKIIFAPTRNYV